MSARETLPKMNSLPKSRLHSQYTKRKAVHSPGGKEPQNAEGACHISTSQCCGNKVGFVRSATWRLSVGYETQKSLLMAPLLLYNDPPPLPYQVSSFLRRRPRQTAILLVCFLTVIFLRAEWAYFGPRLFLPNATLAAPDDESLPLRVLGAEERYQASLRSRQELIWRAGPEPSSVEACVRCFFDPSFHHVRPRNYV